MNLDTISNLRNELRNQVDARYKESCQHFSKHPLQVYGVPMPSVNKTAKAYWKDIHNQSKAEILKLCELLWQSGYQEEAIVACVWSERLVRYLEEKDIHILERWIQSYVSNWAQCDTLCNHTVGDFIQKYPHKIKNLKQWTHSTNLWMRRGAAVSLIIPARKGLFLNDLFAIADLLLKDQEDLVQKGYGWMLKAASQHDQMKVFEYVMERKTVMPRTALRYAIEKMPQELRRKAMAK